MRRLLILLTAVPVLAFAQYPQQGGPALYPHNKNQGQLPPGAVIVEQGGGGIPTSGTEQARELDVNKPGYRRGGPTVYNRSYDSKGATTVITGPDGTTVCRDAYGRKSTTGVCF